MLVMFATLAAMLRGPKTQPQILAKFVSQDFTVPKVQVAQDSSAQLVLTQMLEDSKLWETVTPVQRDINVLPLRCLMLI